MTRTCDILDAQAGFPDDLREWVAPRTLLGLVFEAPQTVQPLGPDCANRRGLPLGTPRILLTVLTYSYAIGLYSSDEIERRILDDPELRYLAAKSCPSGSDLRRFRRLNRLFVQRSLGRLLQLAWNLHFQEALSAVPDRGLVEPYGFSGESLARFLEFAAERRVDRAVLADTMALDI